MCSNQGVGVTLTRCLLSHLVKVFFCTVSRSSTANTTHLPALSQCQTVTLHLLTYLLQSINQKRICIAPNIPQIQRRLADGLSEVGAMIQISFYPRDAMLARKIAIATCLSVTRRYCVKKKKASGMISSPSGSAKTLVF